MFICVQLSSPHLAYFFRDRIPVRNPKRLTEDELRAMAEVIVDEEPVEEVGGEADMSEDEAIEESDHNTDTEEEGDSEWEHEPDSESEEREEYFVGKDKKNIWYKKPVASKFSKTNKKNIIKIFPGPKPCARDITDYGSAFLKFFTNDIIEHIIECTNLEIQKMRLNYDRPREARDTTKTEFLAFLGLLFLAGAKKQNHTHFLELWTNDGTGNEIFRACMGCNRFLFLLSAVRFDDKVTRNDRKLTDKLAAVRFVVDRFIENCKNNYSPGEHLTIDEMLIPFRGRCSFIQYIPSKPAKYGIKVFILCDSKTFYVSNLEIYCGQQPEGIYRKSNTPADITHRLLEPWKGKNRNLTCDNWYTSYPLAKDLLKDKVTLVGTLKKNKRELPADFIPNKTRPEGSSVFGFQKDVTLVSYVPKKNRAVILLSTMHDEGSIDTVTNKPDIILDYNANKGGVDTVDKMCGAFSVSRRTRRWPLVIFFQLMNIASINSQKLYNATHIDNPQKFRRIFLKELSISLMKPYLEERAEIRTLPSDIRLFLNKYKRSQEEQPEEGPPAKIRRRCFCCGRQKNRVTTIKCTTCNRPVCKEHATTIITCPTCKNQDGNDENME